MLWAARDGLDNRRGAMAEVLVGRTGELALISAFVERAATGGAALLLFGEPGAGKTVLLDAAADTACDAGTRVLPAAGAEFEADLTYAGLHQVLLPLFGEFGQLGAVHRDALNAALGSGEGPPPDRLLVCAATLTALRHAAASRPGRQRPLHVSSFRRGGQPLERAARARSALGFAADPLLHRLQERIYAR